MAICNPRLDGRLPHSENIALFYAKLGWIHNQYRFRTIGKFRLTVISLQFGHSGH
jgi:hypothetical protein